MGRSLITHENHCRSYWAENCTCKLQSADYPEYADKNHKQLEQECDELLAHVERLREIFESSTCADITDENLRAEFSKKPSVSLSEIRAQAVEDAAQQMTESEPDVEEGYMWDIYDCKDCLFEIAKQLRQGE